MQFFFFVHTIRRYLKYPAFSWNRKNLSDASPDGQRGSEDISIGSGMSGIPGSPALSSCSEGEPHSPIENYISPSSRSRSPILSSNLPPHTTTTQNDVDSLRLLLQEVFAYCVPFSFHILEKIHSRKQFVQMLLLRLF